MGNIPIIDMNDSNFNSKLDFMLNTDGIPTIDELMNELK